MNEFLMTDTTIDGQSVSPGTDVVLDGRRAEYLGTMAALLVVVDPDTDEPIAVDRDRVAIDEPDYDSNDAWSGGFAANH